MIVTFYGTRGSIPAPGPDTVKYGGNTSCIEVEGKEGVLILDAGSGLRVLGGHLMAAKNVKASILVTHTHWDHIQGAPFFMPFFVPGNSFDIYGPGIDRDTWTGLMFNGEIKLPYGPDIGKTTLEQRFDYQMSPSHFPLKLEYVLSHPELYASISFHDLDPSRKDPTFEIAGFQVTPISLNHTTVTIGYVIQEGSSRLAYITDVNHDARDPSGRNSFNRVAGLVEDAVVIHDAQYTREEWVKKSTWGHSTYESGVALAKEGNADALILFHHDPAHTDREMDALEDAAQTYAGPSLDVIAAKEGLKLRV